MNIKTGNMKKRLAVSVLAESMSQIVIGLIGVLTLKIITNALGIKGYGIYLTVLTFVSTFSLLTDWGLNAITAREIAKRPDDAKEIINHNMGLRLFLTLLAVPAVMMLSFVFYPHGGSQVHLGILLMTCYLFFDAIWATSAAYFKANVRSEVPALVTFGQQILSLLAIAIVSLVGWGLFGFMWAYVATIAIGAAIMFGLLRKYILVRPQANVRLWRQIIRSSMALGLISIVNTIYMRVDSIMISVILGTTAVGPYGIAYSLILAFSSLSGFLMNGLVPSMATAKAKELEQIVQKAFHFMCVIACLFLVGSFVVRRDAVVVVSSHEFISASDPFAILALATAFSFLTSIFGYASFAVNKHHKLVYVSLATLLLNVCINLILIPKYGIVGAAWTTVASEFFSLLITYHIFHKQTGISVRVSVAVKPALAALTILGLSFLLKGIWDTSSALKNVIISGTFVSVVYVTALYITGGLPQDLKSMLDKTFRFAKGQLRL